MKKNFPLLCKSLLGMCLYAATQIAFADASGITCNYTNNFRDTFKVVRQDRPVTVTKNETQFGFSWSAWEYPTDASWEFQVNLTNADQVRVRRL